ncbi:sm-like protein LSM7 [Senna tora]|uniref:Sm-like protein LSM7 n=1 Tax=Senna tora TaxID=362788 RepID=A0A834X0F0_9FABA|nr:sm-like protein LSM7 [Senna tora]
MGRSILTFSPMLGTVLDRISLEVLPPFLSMLCPNTTRSISLSSLGCTWSFPSIFFRSSILLFSDAVDFRMRRMNSSVCSSYSTTSFVTGLSERNLIESSPTKTWKETVLDLAKFVDKGVQVKLTGGRQVTGTLKGYDQLLNLVLDEAVEFLRDSDDPLKTTDQTRRLGLIVCRGTAVMLVSPADGTDEIANPFMQPDGA